MIEIMPLGNRVCKHCETVLDSSMDYCPKCGQTYAEAMPIIYEDDCPGDCNTCNKCEGEGGKL